MDCKVEIKDVTREEATMVMTREDGKELAVTGETWFIMKLVERARESAEAFTKVWETVVDVYKKHKAKKEKQ